MMDKVLIVFLGAAGVAALFFLAIILGTLFGGIAGWVVGGVFPYVTDTLRELSGTTLTNFQLGATLGFFGGFFKASCSGSK
jgi:hypothetical protein